MWNKFKELSFKFFGRSLEPYVSYFESIKGDLQHANIPLSITEYVYSMFFILLLTFVVEFPLIVIITTILMKSLWMAFLLSITVTILIELGMFFMFYTYPSYTANTRRKNIEASLSFATTYMSTIASSGAPPSTMFKVLSQFKEYGEISREAEKINRDVEAFGMDLTTAIRKTAGRTPSAELKELLWGLDTILTTGGNVGDFLHEKSKSFMSEYRRRLEQYSETLSLLIEVYLTVILVGSIFFVIMSALMSIFSGGEMNLFMSFMQFIVVFVVLPAVSMGFIFLIRTLSPSA
ncbi:MAG: type II secretion system F family protein [Candidatus Aenigmarchaeota archaeon]|nr:type II secretion system F family protein [Candidatus Aenigmarchaeota archaeon]